MSFETMLENNPLRGFVRDVMEVKPLRAATDVGWIPRALHVACGNGSSTRLIQKRFSLGRVSAVDQSGAMIADARRLHGNGAIEFSVQDVCALSFASCTFDAAFVLADLHNTADWRGGVRELHRVLKQRGLLILEELSQETFRHGAGRLFKMLTEHPYDTMLTQNGFRDHLLECGFELLRFEQKVPFGLLKYFIAVARKR